MRHTHPLTHARTHLLAALLACAGSVALAQPAPGQPGGQPPGPPAREPGERPRAQREPVPTDSQGFRKWIDRQLESISKREARLRAAIAHLDAGHDTGAVRMELLREAVDDAFAGPRPDGPRQGPAGGPGGGPGGGGAPMGGPDGPGLDYSPTALLSGPRLSPDERAQVREILAQRSPEILNRVRAIAGASPQAEDRLLDGLGSRLRALNMLRERDPQEFQLRVQEITGSLDILIAARDVSRARKQGADAATLNPLNARLAELMNAQFDLRDQLGRGHVAKMRQRADRLEADLAKINASRAETIDRKTADLLRALERGLGARNRPGSQGQPMRPKPAAEDQTPETPMGTDTPEEKPASPADPR
jgi:hypothetical protein